MKTRLILSLLISAICLSSNAQSLRLRRQLRAEHDSKAKLLEPLIPIEEAFELVKAGNGKGYYQIAMRYAQGAELPMDGYAAYKMLCKACDVGYANAILVEGLCDEAKLEANKRNLLAGSNPSENIIRAYCGGIVYNGRKDYDMITNTLAFSRVMQKYEKARDLGALVATNQIAALNKRLADFRLQEAEARQQEAKAEAQKKAADDNNCRLTAILGEDVHKASADEADTNEVLAKKKEHEEMRDELKKIRAELKAQAKRNTEDEAPLQDESK